MIAAFGAAVILPTVASDSAYAQTQKKKDTKKAKKSMGKMPGKKTPGKMYKAGFSADLGWGAQLELCSPDVASTSSRNWWACTAVFESGGC